MTIDEYKKLAVGKGSARARTTSPKPKKKEPIEEPEENPHTIPDLSQTPEDEAMDKHVQIKDAQYVEFGPGYRVLQAFNGKTYRLTIKEEKS